MDNCFEDEIKSFINERLNSSQEALRKDDAEYRNKHKRLQVLTDKVENLKTANEEEKGYVKEYLEVNFDLQVKAEPALYTQGFSDAIQLLKYFGVL